MESMELVSEIKGEAKSKANLVTKKTGYCLREVNGNHLRCVAQVIIVDRIRVIKYSYSANGIAKTSSKFAETVQLILSGKK